MTQARRNDLRLIAAKKTYRPRVKHSSILTRNSPVPLYLHGTLIPFPSGTLENLRYGKIDATFIILNLLLISYEWKVVVKYIMTSLTCQND